MKINIIVDSGADYTAEEIKKYGLNVLPLKLSFGETMYRDGLDISMEEFYELLKTSAELPKTSQICPYEYEKEFKRIKEAEECAVVITLSSELSGCYQSACIAAEDYSDFIKVVDSKSVSLGERLVVQRAMDLIDDGKSIADIADILTEDIKKLKLVAALDTLTYLKKGGRLSAAAYAAGSLLSLKPIVQVTEGAVEYVCAARGHKKIHSTLSEAVKKAGNIDKSMPGAFAYSGTDRGILAEYIISSPDLFPDSERYQVAGIGPAIGTHIGPGAVAVAFFAE